MIDGIYVICVGLHPSVWRANKRLKFITTVCESTGEIKKSLAVYRSMRFIIIENGTCYIRGSLHKFYNGNDTNHNDFTHNDVIKALDSLSCDFSINLHTAEIRNIEAGVNLTLEHSPYLLLKSAVCHKQKQFNLIDADNKLMGKICKHQNYLVKLYDKSRLQKVADKYILRAEVRFRRMSLIEKFGIKILSDLKDKDKIRLLGSFLLEKLNDTVFFDFNCDVSHLTEKKQLKWKQYRDHNFWEETTPQRRYKAKQKYKELIEKYNAFDWGEFLQKEVARKWDELLNGGSNPENKADKQKKGYIIHDLPTEKTEKKEVVKGKCKAEPRFCVSCGRDISNQRADSRFCSESLYGKDAKKCRNKDSNRRNAIKRKLLRYKKLNLPITVTYANGKIKRLKIKKTAFKRSWLDRITKVEMHKQLKNELKVGKNKRKHLDVKANALTRKEEFYNSLVPFVERYSKEVVREFFDYWSEMNRTETKMRFEMERTWNPKLRLDRWERNEAKFNKNSNSSKKEPEIYIVPSSY